MDAAAHKLVIKVTDSGVGIPKEKRDQLFKRFMQSNFSGSSVGVGLHLTHELVNVHKGTITYDENPEGGSVFTVVLSTDTSVYEEKDFLIPNNVLLREEEMAQKHLSDMEERMVSGHFLKDDNELVYWLDGNQIEGEYRNGNLYINGKEFTPLTSDE